MGQYLSNDDQKQKLIGKHLTYKIEIIKPQDKLIFVFSKTKLKYPTAGIIWLTEKKKKIWLHSVLNLTHESPLEGAC